MKFLSRENQVDIIEAFNSTSRYYDDLLNIDTPQLEYCLFDLYLPTHCFGPTLKFYFSFQVQTFF